MKEFFHKQYLWKPFSAKVCQDVRKLSNPHVQSHIYYISVGYLMDFSCSRSMNSRWFLDIFSYGTTNSRSRDPWSKTLWFSATKNMSRLSRHSAIIHEVPHYSGFIHSKWWFHQISEWSFQQLHRSRNMNVRSVCLLGKIGIKTENRSLIFGCPRKLLKWATKKKNVLSSILVVWWGSLEWFIIIPT